MAISVDDTTVARWSGETLNTQPSTSASFTPSDNSLLVLCFCIDENPGPANPSVSGGGTWTIQVARGNSDATEGYAAIATCPITTGTSITVSVTRGGDAGLRRVSSKLYIVTGQHASPIGANAEADWDEDPETLALTATGAGRLFGCGTDWNANGAPSSADTEDAAHYAGAISVMSAYKSADHASGSQSIDFNPAGAPAGNVVILEILSAGAAGRTTKNTRAWPLGMEVGMNFRGNL